ncbi:MAG: glutamyl-tRNA reductase [Microthrixaceae bacterium]
MSLVVVGANHRTAPLDLLERMAVRGNDLPKLLGHLCSGEHTSEAVVLATCNRTEVYLVAERFHGAFGEVRDFFADLTYLPPDRFADSLYVHYDEQAVTHLFEVAAGLDSAVPGEHEILGQVRSAWDVARAEGAAGRGLNLLFRRALEVGKRARTETSIGRHTTSVSHAAVQIAAKRLDGLTDRRALVIGAGTMGARVVDLLVAESVSEVVLANRTVGHAEAVAASACTLDETTAVRAVPLADLDEELAGVDVVFSATDADHTVVEAAAVGPALGARQGSLLMLDLAMPRDLDPALGEMSGVELLDMRDVGEATDNAREERRREAAAVGAIVHDEVRRYESAASAGEVAPLIASVHELAEGIRSAEMQRFVGARDELSTDDREAVEAMTRRIVAKLLHEPTVRLKDAAGSSQGERLATSLAELFDL